MKKISLIIVLILLVGVFICASFFVGKVQAREIYNANKIQMSEKYEENTVLTASNKVEQNAYVSQTKVDTINLKEGNVKNFTMGALIIGTIFVISFVYEIKE